MKMNKVVSTILMVMFIGGIGFLFAFDSGFPIQQQSPTLVETNGEIEGELYDAEGNPVDFKSFEGRIVFINNWASWCPPCVAEMPTIQRLRETMSEKEVVFVMVSFDQNTSKGLKWMKKKKMDLPVYFPGSNFPQKFLTPSIPTTFVLDRNGNVLFTHTGMADYDSEKFTAQMQQWIKQ